MSDENDNPAEEPHKPVKMKSLNSSNYLIRYPDNSMIVQSNGSILLVESSLSYRTGQKRSKAPLQMISKNTDS